VFEEFQDRYPRDTQTVQHGDSTNLPDVDGLRNFVTEFGGSSFGDGIYRVVAPSDGEIWAERIRIAFPKFEERATCFAFDWLGRAFALDMGRMESGSAGVVMFEPGTAEALEIPANLETFHTEELLDYGEAALAISFYQKWLAQGGGAPAYDQCVGYRKPLFLGGADEVENLVISDLDVYWHLAGQLIQQTRGLPPGTVVRASID